MTEPTTIRLRATTRQQVIPPALVVVSAVVIGLIGRASTGDARDTLTSIAIGFVLGAGFLVVRNLRQAVAITDDVLVTSGMLIHDVTEWKKIDDIEIQPILGTEAIMVHVGERTRRLHVPRRGWTLWQDPDFEDKAAQIVAAWQAHR